MYVSMHTRTLCAQLAMLQRDTTTIDLARYQPYQTAEFDWTHIAIHGVKVILSLK